METTLIEGIRILLELLVFLGLVILDGAVIIIIICVVVIVLFAAIIGAFTENDSDSDNQDQSEEA